MENRDLQKKIEIAEKEKEEKEEKIKKEKSSVAALQPPQGPGHCSLPET